MQTTVLYTVKNTEIKEIWVLPSRNLISHRRDDWRTIRACAFLDVSAKEVQPNSCLCRVLHWIQPSRFKGVRSDFLDISLY